MADAVRYDWGTTWQRTAKRVRVPLGVFGTFLFVFLARPTATSLPISLALVVPGLALRTYAAGYLKKKRELANTGPYAHTRNPLYLGSLLIALGFGVAGAWWPLAAGILAAFATIYVPTILGEERFLQSRFPEFDAYRRVVPRLLPRLTPAYRDPEGGGFTLRMYKKNREYQALFGALAIYAALVVRLLYSGRS